MVRGNFPPAHLEANTPEELRMLMLANNAKYKRSFHYFDFSFANKKWHCWFEIAERDRLGIRKNDQEER
jgi:hypothetical protein